MFDAEVCTAIPPSFECLNIGPVEGNKASLPKGVLFLKEEKSVMLLLKYRSIGTDARRLWRDR